MQTIKKIKVANNFTISNNTREDSTHGHQQMINTEIKLIIFFADKDGKARPAADCSSDHEFLIAKFRLKLKQEKPLDHSGTT